jgi:hypothetical protein
VGDERWYLSVADSGQGFPDEFKARFLDATDSISALISSSLSRRHSFNHDL